MSDDPRIGDLLAAHSSSEPAPGGVAMVFFAHDEGVRRNGGRLGARHGPRVFMEHVRRCGALRNPELGVDLGPLHVATVGAWLTEADSSSSLEESHELLSGRVGGVLAAGALPFVVGGSNDQSYANAAALLAHCAGGGRPVACVNIDAHLDVRPRKLGKVHSGSPFRLLLEDERFEAKNFVEFAAQGSQCSQIHADWVTEKGARIMWLSQVKKHAGGAAGAFRELLASWPENAAGFVSFDLDSVSSEYAPGVSCPGVVGLSAEDALGICFAAGEHPSVTMVDLSEFCPEAESYRTGKLVAAMFYHFLLGYEKRLQNAAKK